MKLENLKIFHIQGNSGYLNTRLYKFCLRTAKFAEINKGVCQSCPLSLLYCLEETIAKWQKEDISWIPLPNNQELLKQLFTDNQVIMCKTEDKLQKAAYKLTQIYNRTLFNFNCTENKTKTDDILRTRSI